MTLLVRVLHSKEYLPAALAILASEQLIEKKVMIELVPREDPLRKRVLPNIREFWETLETYLRCRGAQIIYGADSEMITRAHNRLERFGRDNLGSLEMLDEICRVVSEEQDPHFLKVYLEHRPEIIILGALHIPELGRELTKLKIPYREAYATKLPSRSVAQHE